MDVKKKAKFTDKEENLMKTAAVIDHYEQHMLHRARLNQLIIPLSRVKPDAGKILAPIPLPIPPLGGLRQSSAPLLPLH